MKQYKYHKEIETIETSNEASVAFKQTVAGKEKAAPKARVKNEAVKQEEGAAPVVIKFNKAIVKQKKDLRTLLKKSDTVIVAVTKARFACEKNIKDQLTEAMRHLTEVIDKSQITLDNVEKKDKVTEEDHGAIVSCVKDLEKGKGLFEQLVEGLIGPLPSKKGKPPAADPVGEGASEK